MTRMFQSVTETWNCYVGCRFDCDYCWARTLALTRLKHLPRYQDGFTPHLVERELYRKLPSGGFVAVSLMGDIAWATERELVRILKVIQNHPLTEFLLCTKDPSIYTSPVFATAGKHVYFGTTIESNRPYPGTKAPATKDRAEELGHLAHPHKFLSIEPIMDFDVPAMLAWLESIHPDIIEIGADNYGHHLPEPPQDKIETLLYFCKKICPDVKIKPGLERLMPDG